MKDRIEAIHIVALAIDEVKARGTERHARALATLEEGRKLWKEQRDGCCSKCGQKLP